MKHQKIAIVALTAVGFVQAFPKYEGTEKGYLTEKGDYGRNKGDQIAMETTGNANATEKEYQERPPRFGFPAYSQDVQTVNNVLPGVYGPVKLDIGGLVLGTIVGLGAFFIIPKLFHVISTPYGGYRRSEDEGSAGDGGVVDFMSKIQETLKGYDIDSSACLQRAICYSVQSANEKMNNKTANTLESAVDNVTKNDIVKTLIDGTEWRKAIEIGEKGKDCSLAFSKCPVEVDTIISTITRYLMS